MEKMTCQEEGDGGQDAHHAIDLGGAFPAPAHYEVPLSNDSVRLMVGKFIEKDHIEDGKGYGPTTCGD